MADAEFLQTISGPSPTSDPLVPSADIVFVHGLNPRGSPGFARATWTDSNGNFWPEAQLAQVLPASRILLFSYNSRVASDISTNGIKQHANNLLDRLSGKRQSLSSPIIFVAHSLGGLVVKQALVTAKKNNKYKGILEATRGLVFFAVPHQGGHGAKLGVIAKNIVNALTGSGHNDLVESLKHNSLFQENQAEDFKHQLEEYQVITIVEDKPTKVKFLGLTTNMIIVDKKSATLGLAGTRETILTVNSDHSEVCRFHGDDDKLEPIKRALVDLVDGALSVKGLNGEARDPIFSHALPRSSHFVGRQKELDDLSRLLLIGDRCQRAALFGLGGVGKTQIALAFARKVKTFRPKCSILWIPVVSPEGIEQAFLQIARLLDLSTNLDERLRIKEIVRDYLSQDAAGEWLIILDNADSKDLLYGPENGQGFALVDYLPQSDNGAVLFTTRNRELATAVAGSAIIEVLQMGEDPARDLLSGSLSKKELLDDIGSVSALLEALTYLPLAITQAAAYINGKGVSISRYLQLLRNSESATVEVLSENFEDGTRYRSSVNAVARTWFISFQELQKNHRVAADLLAFMSCLEPRAIPQAILPGAKSELAKISALGTLSAYGFISERSDEKMYDLHRLVHLASKNWLQLQGLTHIWIKQAFEQLNKAFPLAEYKNRDLCSQLLPHAQKMLDSPGEENHRARWQLCKKVGNSLEWDGRRKDALKRYTEFERWTNNSLTEDHPDRLSSQHDLAIAYQVNGQIYKAIQLLEHVTTIRKKLAEDHPNRLASQHALAIAYQINGQIHEAIELLEHVTKIKTKLVEDHPDRLAALHALATVYRANGQIHEAIELLEHVTTIKTKLAKDHPERLASQHELATAYQANGQIHEAIQLLEHVTRVRKTMQAEDHPDRLASQHALATAYQTNGQIHEAIELLEHVTTIVAVREAKLARVREQQALNRSSGAA